MEKTASPYQRKGIIRLLTCCVSFLLALFFAGCNPKSDAQTAFYYWKTTLQLNPHQAVLLKTAADNRLYLRLFDVTWDEQKNAVVPNAIVNIRQNIKGLDICPVIYITNKAFEHTNPAQADDLAEKVNKLVTVLSEKYHFNYQNIQIDCDWTVSTRSSYFTFLKAFKRYNQHNLEATIRLHQIKYPERTGVPPADKGLLMFYNMGKVSADPEAANSIYNAADAEKYLTGLPKYTLPLDIALPVFSWSVHIRDGRVIQLYGKIGKQQLSDTAYFKQQDKKNIYRAVKSFYLEGIYFKEGDLLKLEDAGLKELHQAAKQVVKHLAPLKKRNIIYYELSTINLSSLNEKDFEEVSGHF